MHALHFWTGISCSPRRGQLTVLISSTSAKISLPFRLVAEKERKITTLIDRSIQEIHGDVHGSVIQAVQSEVSFNQQVNNAFKEARTVVDTKENVPGNLKKEIKRHLDFLEEELGKKEPDAGKIQKLWKWLKRNANWVAPTLTQVILEGMKLALS